MTDVRLLNFLPNSSFWQNFVNDLVELKQSANLKDKKEIQELFLSVNNTLSLNNANLKELSSLIGHLVKSIPPVDAEKSNAWAKRMDRIQKVGEILWLIDCVKNAKRETDLESQLPDLKKAAALLSQDEVLDERGANLLILCAKSGNYVIRELALDCLRLGANPHSTDQANITALHYACAFNNKKLVKTLLSQGADYSIVSTSEAATTPLSLLMKHGNSSTKLAFFKQKPEVLHKKLDSDTTIYSKALETELRNWGYHELEGFLKKHLTKEILQDCGKTLFQLACKYKDIKWVESTIAAAGDLSENERSCIVDIFNNLAKADQYKKKTLRFLEITWNKNLIPLGPLKRGKSALSIVNNALQLNLQDPILELLKEFENLYTLKHDLLSLNTDSILDKVKACIRQLREKGYAGCDLYEERLKKIESAYQTKRRQVLEWLNQFEIDASVEGPTEHRNGFEMTISPQHLLAFCLKENKQHLIWPLFDKYLEEQSLLFFNKFFYHLVFDKTWMRSPDLAPDSEYAYDGGCMSVNVPFFIQQINRALKSTTLEENSSIRNLLDCFVQNFSLANTRLCLWDLWEKSSQKLTSQIAPEIVESIKDTSQTHILIPTGFKHHAAMLAIEKNATTARLTMHNTGGGLIQHHPQWKHSNRYQTFSIIEEVPLEDLTNVELWGTFIKESCEAASMDTVYACFEELGRRGRKANPSLHSEDFEAKQMNGTCSLQCYLSFFRYQIMSMAEGSKQEKLATYRLAKAYLMSYIIRQSSHRLDTDLVNHSKLKLDKYESFIKLSKIAEDESSYQDHLTLLTDQLSQIGALTLVESIKQIQTSSSFSRLALLEKCSQKLAKHKQIDIMRSAEVWLDRESMLTSIQSLVKHYIDAGDFKTLGTYLARLYLSSRFSKQMEETIVKLAHSEVDLTKKQEMLASLVIKLSRYKPGSWHLHQLCEALAVTKQNLLGDFILQQMKRDAIELQADLV